MGTVFDGKTFSGWHRLGRDTVETNNWKFENGEFHKIYNRLVPLIPNGEKINGDDLITLKPSMILNYFLSGKSRKPETAVLNTMIRRSLPTNRVRNTRHLILNTRYLTTAKRNSET